MNEAENEWRWVRTYLQTIRVGRGRSTRTQQQINEANSSHYSLIVWAAVKPCAAARTRTPARPGIINLIMAKDQLCCRQELLCRWMDEVAKNMWYCGTTIIRRSSSQGCQLWGQASNSRLKFFYEDFCLRKYRSIILSQKTHK